MRSDIRSHAFRIVLFSSFLIFTQGAYSSLLQAQTKDTTRIDQVQPIEVRTVPAPTIQYGSRREIIRDYIRFSWPSYIAPVLITGYGVAAIGPSTLIYDRFQAKRDIQKAFPGFHNPADNVLQFVPVATTFSLSLCGVKGKHGFYEQVILYAGSIALSEAITTGLKYSTRMLRPDGSAYNSFPSGHSNSAFTGAEVMNQEYQEQSVLYPILGYTVASATGMMRMMNNRHWLSDVLVGAGVGMISTKVVYAVYPFLKRKYWKRKQGQEFIN
jgi:membrane-associated phospholipid phosphatase